MSDRALDAVAIRQRLLELGDRRDQLLVADHAATVNVSFFESFQLKNLRLPVQPFAHHPLERPILEILPEILPGATGLGVVVVPANRSN